MVNSHQLLNIAVRGLISPITTDDELRNRFGLDLLQGHLVVI